MSLGPGIGKKAPGSKLSDFRERSSLSDNMVFRKILSYYAENKSHDVDNCPDYSSIFVFPNFFKFHYLKFYFLKSMTSTQIKNF